MSGVAVRVVGRAQRGPARPSWRRLARAGSILALATLVVWPPAAAGSSGIDGPADHGAAAVEWGIRPADGEHGADRANFRYTVRAGSTIHDALVVTNRGGDHLTLGVYGSDGELRGEHVELAAPESASEGLGAWLVAPGELELAPGESIEVPFTLTIPAEAPPGAHAGGLVTSSIADDGSGVAVDRRLAASIVVTVTASSDASSSRAPDDARPGAATPPLVALLALAGLAVVAGVVWFVVVQGRANP